MDGAVGGVGRHIVVLVGVARIVEIGFVHRIPVDVGADVAAGIAVGPFAPGLQQNVLAVDEVFDDMRSAVFGIGRVAVGGSYVGIHGSESAAYAHTVEFDAFHADGRVGVSEVDEGARRAHGAESTGGYDVHLVGYLFRRHREGELRHLLGSQYDRFAVLNPFVYLLICFRHGNEITGHS